jgi:serine/threonine-protein kinase PpkA
MQPAVASTVNWREDAFAGIDLAIGDLSWDEVDTRLVFLITDASPRSVGDALASDTRMGPETINALAAQRNISLFVLHMQTEEAATISQNDEGYDDTVRGQQLYLRLAQTGDAAISKYFSVQGQTEQAFTDSLELVASLVIDQLSQLSLGGQLTDTSTALDDPFLAAISGGGPVVIDDEGDAPLVAAAVAGELFRYQTEYLGARSGVEAPDFYRAWAIDRDFANPNRRSLEVSVFVTREQLSDLANRLEDIVIRLREKDLGMGDFFTSVQAEAGSTAVDPEFRTFLPSYLEDLPYVTKFMNMTPRLWDDLGESGRTELLDEVEAKLASYRRIYATQDGWIRLDERSSEEEVYPLPLRDLP